MSIKNTEPRVATLIDTVLNLARSDPEQICFWDEGMEDGRWHAVTRGQFLDQVKHLAKALRVRGVSAGDRVGILMCPRSEWEVADKAIMYLGGITVGLDYKSSPEDIGYVIAKAEVTVLIAESPELLALVPVDARNSLALTVLVEDPGHEPGSLSLHEMLAQYSDTPDFLPAAKADDVAVLIFTSGTTSHPKGIPLKHGQLVQSLPVMSRIFAEQLKGKNRTLAWIPLYNGTGRMMGSINFNLGVEQYFVRDPMTLFEKVKDVNPTYLVLMPRILEKVYQGVGTRLRAQPLLSRILVHGLLAMRGTLPFGGALALTDRLLIAKIREAIWGDSLRFLISGSAPIDDRILRFFDRLGTPTFEVYGMSELAVLISMNRPGHRRYGSVGQPLDGMDVKLADDNEILVKSAAALDNYWGESEATGLKDEAGYLKTGDLGKFRRGYLYIAGRKKEIIKTSTGQRISPVAVENVYRDVPGVESLIVIGNGRKFLSALVTLDASFANRLRVQGKDSHDYLNAEFAKRGTRLGENRRIKKFAVLDQPFSVEHGELTSTLKFRRSVIEERHRETLDKLYAPK